MARLLAFTYAGLTIGAGQTAGASYRLVGKHAFEHAEERAELSFEVVVTNSTRATYLTDLAALLSAYRKQDQTLTVVLGGTTQHTYVPASNTGFNIRSKARLVPGQQIDIQLPPAPGADVILLHGDGFLGFQNNLVHISTPVLY